MPATAADAPNRPERPKAAPRALSGLLPYLRPYKRQVAAAALALLLAAAATLVFPVALRYLIDSNISPVDAGNVPISLRNGFLGLFAVAAALGLFSAARFYFVSWIGERVTADVRNAVFAHVLRQSPEFFETTATGEVLSRLNADTTLVQTVIGSSLSMGLRNLVMGSGALLMLVVTNPRVMGLVLGVLALIVMPSLWFGRRVRKLSRASQDRVADTSALAGELLNAATTVQSYTAEARESARYAQATEAAFATAARRSRIRAALIAFIIIGTSAALLWGLWGGTQAVIAGRISAGHLGQTVVYVIILASAFAILGEVYGDVQRAAGATERLMELLASQSPVAEPVSPKVIEENQHIAGISAQCDAINFDGLTFHYPSRPNTAALADFSLHIAPGETVALVGASGAGKTTVFQLLQRQYDPQSGSIRLGGHDIKHLSFAQLRGSMSVVSQEPVIFSANAADNIRYGLPNATDAEVEAAARAAFAHDFIAALPGGYQTFLGERGVRLSGGQRQRIAIARAILKNAPILLLDEATSALDAESERMVQAALDNAMNLGGKLRTTLVIAHRLATVQKAHRIVVLDAGRIAEIGTHAELIAKGGVYAGLAALQFGSGSAGASSVPL
jgi:ATP-binding cassette, subfamily B, bacterial